MAKGAADGQSNFSPDLGEDCGINSSGLPCNSALPVMVQRLAMMRAVVDGNMRQGKAIKGMLVGEVGGSFHYYGGIILGIIVPVGLQRASLMRACGV